MFSFKRNNSAAEQIMAGMKMVSAEPRVVRKPASNEEIASMHERSFNALADAGYYDAQMGATITPNAIAPATKPARPGDSEPRSFVGNTLDKLNAVKDNYSTERDLLAKDIAKLVEEHRQVLLALEAVAKAIEHLDGQPTQMEMKLDEATAEALRLMGDDATE